MRHNKNEAAEGGLTYEERRKAALKVFDTKQKQAAEKARQERMAADPAFAAREGRKGAAALAQRIDKEEDQVASRRSRAVTITTEIADLRKKLRAVSRREPHRADAVQERIDTALEQLDAVTVGIRQNEANLTRWRADLEALTDVLS